MTLASQSDYEATPTPATRDAFRRNKAVTNAARGVAGAAALAGSILWLTLRF